MDASTGNQNNVPVVDAPLATSARTKPKGRKTKRDNMRGDTGRPSTRPRTGLLCDEDEDDFVVVGDVVEGDHPAFETEVAEWGRELFCGESSHQSSAPEPRVLWTGRFDSSTGRMVAVIAPPPPIRVPAPVAAAQVTGSPSSGGLTELFGDITPWVTPTVANENPTAEMLPLTPYLNPEVVAQVLENPVGSLEEVFDHHTPLAVDRPSMVAVGGGGDGSGGVLLMTPLAIPQTPGGSFDWSALSPIPFMLSPFPLTPMAQGDADGSGGGGSGGGGSGGGGSGGGSDIVGHPAPLRPSECL